MRNKHSYRHKFSLSCFHASVMDGSRTGGNETRSPGLGEQHCHYQASFFPFSAPVFPASLLPRFFTRTGMCSRGTTKQQWPAPRYTWGTGVRVRLPFGWWHGQVCPPGKHQGGQQGILRFEGLPAAHRMQGTRSQAAGCEQRVVRAVLAHLARTAACFGPGPTAPRGRPWGSPPAPQPCRCGKERLVEALVGTQDLSLQPPQPGSRGAQGSPPGGHHCRGSHTPSLCTPRP